MFRLTQSVHEVDQPPRLILVPQVHIRRLVDDDRLEIRSDGDVIRRPERLFAQVGKGEPGDLVHGPGDLNFTTVHVDRRGGACGVHRFNHLDLNERDELTVSQAQTHLVDPA
jgi:hypothetical protein